MTVPPPIARTPSRLDACAARAADALIRLYQAWLSPLKGSDRACAHRVLHGGESCSQHVRTLVRRVGLWDALPGIAARFEACRVAAERLNPPAGASVGTDRHRRHRRGQCCIVLPLPMCTTTRTGRIP